MPFNINEFIGNLSHGGLAKGANFEVTIHRPFGSAINQERDLVFRCASVTTPGRNIFTTDATDYSMPRPIGYMAVPDDVSMRIILSEDLREKVYFEQWVDEVVGNYRLGSMNDQMFDVGFYDTYALNTVVDIVQFAATGVKTHKHTLREAFPVYVGSIQNDWSDDSILYLDVNWRYRFYTNSIIQG